MFRGYTPFARFSTMLLLALLLFFPCSIVAGADNPKPAADAAAVQLPEVQGVESVDRIVAGLSDEQVRRLLIDELKAQALREAEKSGPEQATGIAGFIAKTKNLIATLQKRIELLRSGGTSAAQQVKGVFALLGTGERQGRSTTSVILSVSAVLAGGLLIQWLFVLYTRDVRRRISETTPTGWGSKIGTLLTRVLLDLVGVVIFTIAALAFFYGFLDRIAGQRILLATYLSAIATVQGVWLVSRFFLAPGLPNLRFLPFTDETARYLHRWLMAITAVATFGLLTCGVIRLAGATELTYFKLVTLVGLILAAMIIWMIVQKRQAVADAFSQNLSESGLLYRLAQKWHHFAIFGVLVLLFFSTGARIMGTASGQGLLTLLMVPLYFLLDWILRLMLEAAFGIIEAPREGAPAAAAAAEKADELPARETEDHKAGGEGEPPPPAKSRMDLGRMKRALRTSLRLALAALLFFWVFKIWGIEFPIGQEVARTVLRILIVVLICYIAYGLANAAIMRRLRREMPAEEDEEMEEGGAGGSRIGTLLMLLRKFMLVVIIVMAALIILSSMGVNIGPLIAGAGVFGLAIGFGAQTLVKDIISGMFFLIDDAIRVGDFVECGSAKGVVEQISLRSLRLRHPRGRVHILPFGDIKNVTNLSRDYVVMKLDFRVRYDADVEKIRKIIKKKVYKKIKENPELGPKLLEPIKSQGVREMDDSAMVMRVKYKTKPGDQFAIRKEVYRLMQEAFKEEGIEFAHRNVTVYVPPEIQQSLSHADEKTRQQVIGGAAAAVVAAEEKDKAKSQGSEPGS